jgi:3-oxoacyl-[acyl-carrier protein] reductase
MANDAGELSGKVAVVTGAGRNIGRAIALALARAGASVVVNARTNRQEAGAVCAEIAREGGQALAHLADVADAGAVERMAEVAAARTEAKLDDITPERWRAILGPSLDGPFYCARACATHLRNTGAGAIINIGGLSGHTGAKGRVHVVTAKAGIVGLTRALANELAADGITVNCVVPGLIDTARAPGAPMPSHHQVHRTLVGRLGVPDDIAAAVCFLAGPQARYITGQTLHVNGGMAMY